MNDTRYIDTETGKLRDSARSEMVGGLSGALAGSLAINAIGEYGTMKEGLTEQARIPEAIADLEGVIDKDRLDLEMADLARAYQTDPSVLDQYPEGARDIIKRDVDLLGRLHERERWDRFNEFPLQERVDMFIKGKPSLDGFDPNVADELTGIYGPRPLDPGVSGFLRDEIARNEQNIKGLRSLMDEPVRYDWRRAAPSLDHYKPRNLLGTAMNPYVTAGLFSGALAGTVYDEYRKHRAAIEQREAAKLEKAAALKLPKLKLPKPKGPEMPKKEPLVPKNVKRVGILAGTAGAAGYTGIKGIQHYQDGSAYAGRIQQQGMAAQSPDQIRKERERMMKGAQETNQEGMDLHMKTAYERYLELEKEAGLGNLVDKVKKTVSDASGKQVKKWEGAVENAKANGMGEKGLRPTEKKLEEAIADQSKARKQVGITAGAGAAGIGGAAAGAHALDKDNEKVAAVVDEEQPRQGLIGKGTKIGAGIGAGIMAPIGMFAGADMGGGTGGALAGGVGGGIQGAIAGGLIGTGAELAMRANRALVDRELENAQVKTAYETYLELEKVAAIPGVGALKKGMNHLTGKNVKFNQGLLDDAIKRGDGIDSVQSLQKNVDQAKKSRNIARGATAAGAAVGGAATAGGVMAAQSNRQEKIAFDASVEDSQFAVDHPYKKTIKDFAGVSAGVGAGIGGLSGLAAGAAHGGVPGAIGGLVGGGLLGGGVGGVLGATSGIQHGVSRAVAQKGIEDGQSGMSHGALAGAGAGLGVSLLSGAGKAGVMRALANQGMDFANVPGMGRNIAGDAVGATLAGGGIGALLGRNQQQHNDNLAPAGADEAIGKAAEEVINELFKEASAVIDDAPMEKVATVTSPIEKIDGTLFGYDRLK